jgi:DegV family protein with EDD domain
MPGVRIVTDSMSYLPRGIVDELGITVVPLYYDVGDGLVRESDFDGDHDAFYARLERTPSAHSSPPTSEDFVAAFHPLVAAGHDVVSVHLSSTLSLTCNAAREAARRLEAEGAGAGRVTVVDSAGLAVQTALVTLVAARAAQAGLGSDEVAERARRGRAETRGWFLFDTLEYLRRSGRIGTGAAWVGSVLQVKPILTVESEMTAVERVRTRQRAVERLTDLMRRQASLGADTWAVQHTRAEDDAGALIERLHGVFRRPPVVVAEMGPCAAVNGGPGVLSCAAGPSCTGG